MGAGWTKNGIIIKDKTSEFNESRVSRFNLTQSVRDDSVFHESYNTISINANNSDVDDLQVSESMRKMKNIKEKIQRKKDEKSTEGEESKYSYASAVKSYKKANGGTHKTKKDYANGCYEQTHDFDTAITEDDYTIGHEIGHGSAGTWFNALNINTGKVITIKTLDFSELEDDAVEHRIDYLRSNIKNLIKDVHNDNIIKYIGVVPKTKEIAESKSVDVLMEYVPGGNLRFILDNFVKFKEKLVKSYTRQILEGLKKLHENNIWHGDLKVSNLLIDDLGILKLSDFRFIKQTLYGTSKFMHLQKFTQMDEDESNFETFNGPMWGSEVYTWPECIQDIHSELNPAYDIWALGWVVIEMLTGKEPWAEYDGDMKAILKNLESTISWPKISVDISKECKSFLTKCFQLDLENRATVQELLEHPFANMSEKEVKESLEASNFISFFSILASQKSINDNVSGDELLMGDTGGGNDYNFKKYQNSDSVNCLPNIEIRVSKVIMDKLRASDVYNSIVSNGSIQLNNLSKEDMSAINDNFKIDEYTHTNLRDSIENIHASVSKHNLIDSRFRSNSRLALVLQNLKSTGNR